MIVSFTLPLLFVSCVLVYILWSRQDKKLSSDVEASSSVSLLTKHTDDPKLFKVINNLYTMIQGNILQDVYNRQSSFDDRNRLKKTTSVASRLIRFGRIQDMEGLVRLTSHLTGVVIVQNPVLDHKNSEREADKKGPRQLSI